MPEPGTPKRSEIEGPPTDFPEHVLICASDMLKWLNGWAKSYDQTLISRATFWSSFNSHKHAAKTFKGPRNAEEAEKVKEYVLQSSAYKVFIEQFKKYVKTEHASFDIFTRPSIKAKGSYEVVVTVSRP